MSVNSWVIVVDLRAFPFEGTRVGLMLHNQKWCSQWPRIGDISTPMKQLLGPAFCQVEARINQVIRPKFDLSEIPGHEYRIIRQADEMVTHAGALHFLGNGRSMFVNSWVIVVDLRVFPFKGTRVGLMLNNQKWCSQWPRIT